MIEGEFLRVHPSTVLIALVEQIRRMLGVIIILVISTFTAREGDPNEILFGALGFIAVIFAAIQYFSFGYRVVGDHLETRSGILGRHVRIVPLARIQNVNITRTWVHRILGLVELQIETASGAGAEVKIGALQEPDAHRLKEQLTGISAPSEVFAAPVQAVHYRASVRDLIFAGMTENRAFVIVASAFGLIAFTPGGDDAIIDALVDWVKGHGYDAMPWWVYALGLLAFFLLGWILSIIFTLVQFWGFELSEHDGKLRRQYGLINTYENVVPRGRIQIVRSTQSFVQSWFGYSKLHAETAGSFVLNEQGGKTLLAPLVLGKDQADLKQLALSGRDIRHLDWHAIPRRAFWVHWRWSALVGLAIGAGVGYRWEWLWGAGVAAVWLLLSAWGQTMAVRRSAFAVNDELVAGRKGWLLHQVEYLPLARIQAVNIDTSPFQRRLRLATVTLISAAVSPSGRTVVLQDMEEAEAEELADRVFRLSQEQARDEKSEV